jgi:hypothetical protein
VPSFAEAVAVVLREARATTFPSGA